MDISNKKDEVSSLTKKQYIVLEPPPFNKPIPLENGCVVCRICCSIHKSSNHDKHNCVSER